jgi:hypothetical protein
MRCDFADDKERCDWEGSSNEVPQAEGAKIQAKGRASSSLGAEARDETDWHCGEKCAGGHLGATA